MNAAPLFITEEIRAGGGAAEAPSWRAILDAHRVRRSERPKVIPPALVIDGAPIAKPGDITSINAQAKSGKTAFINGTVAAALVTETGAKADTLGVTANPRPRGAVIVWFDTEQSDEDAWAGLDRAARRAGLEQEQEPEWVRTYRLADYTPSELRAMLTDELAHLRAEGVPVWFVIVDGIADFCANPNDIEESQDVVREIRAHAIANTCPVICVIHRNEGDKADSSPRGHLGKELLRKAACNISLEKADEITTVWCTKNRGAPILKKDGPRFKWSDRAGMHVTVASAGQASEDRKTTGLRDLVDDVLPAGSPPVSWAELKAGIIKARDYSPRTAEKKIEAIKDQGLILSAGSGTYARA
jgi:hypothetical protein